MKKKRQNLLIKILIDHPLKKEKEIILKNPNNYEKEYF